MTKLRIHFELEPKLGKSYAKVPRSPSLTKTHQQAMVNWLREISEIFLEKI
jgi:hypothetical protein